MHAVQAQFCAWRPLQVLVGAFFLDFLNPTVSLTAPSKSTTNCHSDPLGTATPLVTNTCPLNATFDLIGGTPPTPIPLLFPGMDFDRTLSSTV